MMKLVLAFFGLLATGMFGGFVYQTWPTVFWILMCSYGAMGVAYAVRAFVKWNIEEERKLVSARQDLMRHFANERRREKADIFGCRWCDNEADCDTICPKHGMICECCPVCRLECAGEAIKKEEEEQEV